MKRVLILEPYFGGSHRHFLEGLQAHVAAEYIMFTLPARKWKMRMQLSAVWFIEQLNKLPPEQRHFDTVLLSTFCDAAVFRAMLYQVPGWNHQARIVTYFHENQFAYPQQFEKFKSQQFTAINVHSALASDSIGFNSTFNMDTFLRGCRLYQKKVSDMDFSELAQTLQEKSRVLHPGIDFGPIDDLPWKKQQDLPTIVWNHRWEHDKNPESFFQALSELEKRGIDFRLLVLGQSFTRCPSSFIDAKLKFKDRIVHFGYAETYQDYAALLSMGDIVVSTAHHEFFGIAVIEAVRAGCIPVLPDRLSYPELFDSQFLYQEKSLVDTLQRILRKGNRLERNTARLMTERFSWHSLAEDYSAWLFGY